MPTASWRRVLVLGGIRSGKSEFAEELATVRGERVRYLATARAGGHDPEWRDPEWLARIAAHRARRPPHWPTTELGDDPGRLADEIAAADTRETLIVDDLSTWLGTLLEFTEAQLIGGLISRLADAVITSPAALVLVSAEVGLGLVPLTPVGRAFADGLGTTNRAVAAGCDTVALVVAGQVVWLKGGP
jgi:adenosyl cobinamide kinase/adenosyl cobinamide phosphate guanylyltransferase